MSEDNQVLLYDERGHEIEPPDSLPVLTYRFVVPLFLITMAVWFFVGRDSKAEPSVKFTGITITNTSWVWTAPSETYVEQKAPNDHPPLKIMIEGEPFTIHYAKRSEMLKQHCLGQTLIEQKEIWLPVDSEGREARETMLHELMHVALHEGGGPLPYPINPDSSDGESIINPSARILLNIFRDNERLMGWLKGNRR